MLQLSLLATAMGHYTWLRSASERLSQFSRRPVCTGLKKIKGLEKMKGLASHPWAVYSANWPVTQMAHCCIVFCCEVFCLGTLRRGNLGGLRQGNVGRVESLTDP